MSKEIGRTVAGRRIAWLIAMVAAVAVFIAMVLQTAPASAGPPTDIDFTKVGENVGDPASGVVLFTITIENRTAMLYDEESDTHEVHYTPRNTVVRDILPAQGQWLILGASTYDEPGGEATPLECTSEPGAFECDIPPIPGRHLNEAEDDFVNGYAVILVYGVLNQCGTVTNTALLIGTSLLPRYAIAQAGYPCPQPPTVTPTIAPPTPTSTAIPSTPTATATPTRRAPLPPNTGDSRPDDRSQSPYWLYAAISLGAIAFGTGTVALYKRRE